MSEESSADPPLSLRRPGVAALLAFLLPGAGHLYQGRLLKSAIYFFGVLGLFVWGLSSAEGKSVYFRPPAGEHARDMKEFIGFVAQAGVGLPVLPALLQHRRYYAPGNSEMWALREPLHADFRGLLRTDFSNDAGPAEVAGELDLVPTETAFGLTLAGTFTGETAGGEAVSLRVGDQVTLGAAVEASSQRAFRGDVLNPDGEAVGTLDGFVARPVWNWYAVPPSPAVENEINARLGTNYDLAYVMIMIAGLLNMLAIYDALEGPALGQRLAA